MGQTESLPALPGGKLKFEATGPDTQEIPFFVRPDHPITTIVLRHCRLERFPLQLLHLRRLELHGCSLSKAAQESLSMSHFEFPNLVYLQLADFRLPDLPRSVADFDRLQTLIFTGSRITSLPRLNCPNLSHLDLFVNCLAELPRNLPDALTALKLGFNSLAEFEMASDCLEDLNLSGNLLTAIGPSCAFLKLTALDLSFNAISQIDELSQTTPQLKTLAITHNQLKRFPRSLPPTIQWVDAGYNQIGLFVEPLLQYCRLSHLDLRANPIRSLPQLPPTLESLFLNPADVIISPSPALKGFDFLWCDFTALPNLKRTKLARAIRFIGCGLRLCPTDILPSTLQIVDLSNNGLQRIDVALLRLPELRLLRLVGNGIAEVPPQIKDTSLTLLAIGRNPIMALPPLPKSLEVLDCCHCMFTGLPATLQGCRMKSVDFSCNCIACVSFLPRALELNMSMNCLRVLPEIPRDCRVVDFSHNKLVSFALAKQFTSVDISHNDLHGIVMVDEDVSCPELLVLKLSHNPNCDFCLGFANFPKLTHVDLCGTRVNHPFPIPEQFQDFIVGLSDFFRMAKGVAVKYFSDDTGYSEAIGGRTEMQDALVISHGKKMSVYGVVDGHGGAVASHTIARYLPMAFQKVGMSKFDDIHAVFKYMGQLLFQLKVADGAVIGLAVFRGTRLGVAHMGDVRILMVQTDGEVRALTKDHKASDREEIHRLKENRSFIRNGRVHGTLAVSRTMGDFVVNGVLRKADLSVIKLDANCYRVVIACDGVFDVLDNQTVAKLVMEEPDVHRAAALIKHVTRPCNSTDNISVVVVDVQSHLRPAC
jgi:serine/threonine protein phosphatase PrpC/Leucine-rich repeat (LRR) protein